MASDLWHWEDFTWTKTRRSAASGLTVMVTFFGVWYKMVALYTTDKTERDVTVGQIYGSYYKFRCQYLRQVKYKLHILHRVGFTYWACDIIHGLLTIDKEKCLTLRRAIVYDEQ